MDCAVKTVDDVDDDDAGVDEYSADADVGLDAVNADAVVAGTALGLTVHPDLSLLAEVEWPICAVQQDWVQREQLPICREFAVAVAAAVSVYSGSIGGGEQCL